ncbi:MAG: hypothetical protein KAG56_08650 [Sulfurovaceae bacterium]|nr:hypothetical protein [Sulfurovaceae bacterium]
MKKIKLLLFSLVLMSTLSQAYEPITYIRTLPSAEDDKKNVWLRFKDNTKGKLFKIYLDDVLVYTAKESKDGKTRVVPLDLSELPSKSKFILSKGFSLKVEIIDDIESNKYTIDKHYGVESDIFGEEFPIYHGDLERYIQKVMNKTKPDNLKFLGYDKGKTWLKFTDNSDGDFFRIFVDGKENNSIAKDYKDTKERNGKSRVIGLDLKALTDGKTEYKHAITVALYKNGKRIRESDSKRIGSDELIFFTYNIRQKDGVCQLRDPKRTSCLRFYDTSKFGTGSRDYSKDTFGGSTYYKEVKYKIYIDEKEIKSPKISPTQGGPYSRVKNLLVENLTENQKFTARVEAYFNGAIVSSKIFNFTQE